MPAASVPAEHRAWREARADAPALLLVRDEVVASRRCATVDPACRRRWPIPATAPFAPAHPRPRRAAPRIVDQEKERRRAGPRFASGPVACDRAGRGHRRGLDGPPMPGPQT